MWRANEQETTPHSKRGGGQKMCHKFGGGRSARCCPGRQINIARIERALNTELSRAKSFGSSGRPVRLRRRVNTAGRLTRAGANFTQTIFVVGGRWAQRRRA
jgi:hypothetical protein